jgi:hypothetical protein
MITWQVDAYDLAIGLPRLRQLEHDLCEMQNQRDDLLI